MIQHTKQAVDISRWNIVEDYGSVYPEGAREKILLVCPTLPSFAFLEGGHWYLFKKSRDCYPDQYWTEIFAFKLGQRMDINVPPAFVAFDKNFSGVLIRWFLNKDDKVIPGGDLFQNSIAGFDRKKGLKHNFLTLEIIFSTIAKCKVLKQDWKEHWAKTFLFDALIGNIDRHQENWSIIEANGEIHIAPVFDNGTSMGHEIHPEKFKRFDDENYLERYVNRGCHHIRWEENGGSISHLELIKRLIVLYPQMRETMLKHLMKIDYAGFKEILDTLQSFAVPVILSRERANFMLKLINYRYQKLLNELKI